MRPARAAALAAGVLGASSMLAQLALLREMMAALGGLEIVLGVLLGAWLLLAGLGAALPVPRRPRRVLAPGLALLTLLPLAQVAALRVLRDALLPRGVQPGLGEILGGSLLLLAPYGLLSGFLVAACCAVRGDQGKVYRADALGCAAGAAAFALLIEAGASHFAILQGQALLGAGAAFGLSERGRGRALAGGLAVLVLLAPWRALDEATARAQVAGQALLHAEDSPYGRLMVTELAGQRTLLEDLAPLATAGDVEEAEARAHLALAQRPAARRVLLVSGGVGGTAREALRWGVSEVRYVELDPRVLALGRAWFPDFPGDARLRPEAGDGRRFVQRSRERFDVAIVAVPGPSTCLLNRFYTREFLEELKGRLEPGGVVALSPLAYANHLGPEGADLVASAWRTLRAVFRNVRMVPLGRVHFLASDGPLDADVPRELARAGIACAYLGPDWMREAQRPDRVGELQRAAEARAPENRDFRPVLCYLDLRRWLSMAPPRLGLAAAAGALALAAWFGRAGAAGFALFAAGFVSSALEVVLLLAFQILYGSVYRQAAVLVTLFMAGLAAGAWAGGRLPASRWVLPLLASGQGLLALALPRILGARPGAALLGLLVLALALATGMIFAAASRLVRPGRPARLFTAEDLGACLGSLLVSAVLVPLAGVAGVCAACAGLGLAAAFAAGRLGRAAGVP